MQGDYIIASPWLFDFAREGRNLGNRVVLGISTILYSLLQYELGVSGKF